MKKQLILLLLFPAAAYAQTIDRSSRLIGYVVVIGIALLIFLVFRQVLLWYWKVDKLVAYQEQNITALQSIHINQEQLIKLTKEQNDLLRKIRDNGTTNN